MSVKRFLDSDTKRNNLYYLQGTRSTISKCASLPPSPPLPTQKETRTLKISQEQAPPFMCRTCKQLWKQDDRHFDQQLHRQSTLSLNLEKQSTISVTNPQGFGAHSPPKAFDLQRTPHSWLQTHCTLTCTCVRRFTHTTSWMPYFSYFDMDKNKELILLTPKKRHRNCCLTCDVKNPSPSPSVQLISNLWF